MFFFNQMLWTYSTLSFLPHGCYGDASDIKGDIPIWLSTGNRFHQDFNSDYSVLISTCAYLFPIGDGERVVDIFFNEKEAQEGALGRARAYREQGMTPTLYVEAAQGSWVASKFDFLEIG